MKKDFISKVKNEKETEIKNIDLEIIKCKTEIELHEKEKEYCYGFIHAIDFCLRTLD